MIGPSTQLEQRAETLRDAADILQRRHPAASAELRGLAAAADVEASLARRREREAAERRVAAMDKRSRWVRRSQGNGGPGVPGLGHVTRADLASQTRDAHAVCGRRLRGALHWHGVASSHLAPAEWEACPRCAATVRARVVVSDPSPTSGQLPVRASPRKENAA